MKQNEIRQEYLTGERALFMSKDLAVFDSVFADGESPLKESENIELYDSLFRWKYPLWYCNHVRAERCTWFDMARAGGFLPLFPNSFLPGGSLPAFSSPLVRGCVTSPGDISHSDGHS